MKAQAYGLKPASSASRGGDWALAAHLHIRRAGYISMCCTVAARLLSMRRRACIFEFHAHVRMGIILMVQILIGGVSRPEDYCPVAYHSHATSTPIHADRELLCKPTVQPQPFSRHSLYCTWRQHIPYIALQLKRRTLDVGSPTIFHTYTSSFTCNTCFPRAHASDVAKESKYVRYKVLNAHAVLPDHASQGFAT